jgi:hypothetical protein
MKATSASSSNKADNTTANARKPRKKATEQPAAVAQPEAAAPANPSKLLVFKRSRNNGFYVYLLGVMPDDNCRTAKSAMRFMLWKKRELGASISQSHFAALKQLAAAEG